MQNDTLKTEIISALRQFVRKRPRLDGEAYRGAFQAYRAEARRVSRDLKDAETLLRQVELSPSITGREMVEASRGRRLRITETPQGVRVEYVPGQNYPTEYRAAVASYAASVLRDFTIERATPPRAFTVAGTKEYATMDEASAAARDYLPAIVSIEETYNGQSMGDWLAKYFRREYGRGMAARWFN